MDVMLLVSLFLHNFIGVINNNSNSPRGNMRYSVAPRENFTNSEIEKIGRENLCRTSVVTLSFNRFLVTARPMGNCYYCCPPRRKDVQLFLYTKRTWQEGTQIKKFKPGMVAAAGFNPLNPTVVYVHGFVELSPDGASCVTVKNAYLNRPENYNVIIVNWSNLSAAPWYIQATKNTRLVGKVLANFLRIYHESGEIPIDSVHIVGFSLGSHIAGFTGKYLGDLRVSRITGLDPALPLFTVEDYQNRLSKDDAEFVDIVHTDPGKLGFQAPIGHVDFYPNYEIRHQPGCSLESLVFQNRIDDMFSCNHQRAWQFYAESVSNPHAFPATTCEHFAGKNRTCRFSTDAFLGFAVARNALGSFYLQTNKNSPFGLDELRQQQLL